MVQQFKKKLLKNRMMMKMRMMINHKIFNKLKYRLLIWINFQLKRGDRKKQAKINAVSDTVEIFENILKVEKRKSPFDYQLILNAFNDHFIFKSVP